MHHCFSGCQQHTRAPHCWKATAFCLPRTNADTQSNVKQDFTSKGTLPGLARSRAASEPLPSALLVFLGPPGPGAFLPGPLPVHPALLFTLTPKAQTLPESGPDHLNRAECQVFKTVGWLGRKIHEKDLPCELWVGEPNTSLHLFSARTQRVRPQPRA